MDAVHPSMEMKVLYPHKGSDAVSTSSGNENTDGITRIDFAWPVSIPSSIPRNTKKVDY